MARFELEQYRSHFGGSEVKTLSGLLPMAPQVFLVKRSEEEVIVGSITSHDDIISTAYLVLAWYSGREASCPTDEASIYIVPEEGHESIWEDVLRDNKVSEGDLGDEWYDLGCWDGLVVHAKINTKEVWGILTHDHWRFWQ